MNYRICIHGGAGALSRASYTPSEIKEYENALTQALSLGLEKLSKGGSALSAVTSAVVFLEDCPLFNAGKGSVFSNNSTVEMDASIMNGASGKCGGVSNVMRIKNPILAAEKVMLYSPHTLLCADGAEKFAADCKLQLEPNEYFHTSKRLEQLHKAQKENLILMDHGNESGTVGAVAIDTNGNLAAATSTGGMTNKMHGRVSDSSIPGSGTWAQNGVCAFSGTGTGDIFIQNASAKDFAALIEYAKFDLEKAAQKVLNDIKKQGGSGGLIAIDAAGNFIMPYNSSGMFRGMGDENGVQLVAIF